MKQFFHVIFLILLVIKPYSLEGMQCLYSCFHSNQIDEVLQIGNVFVPYTRLEKIKEKLCVLQTIQRNDLLLALCNVAHTEHERLPAEIVRQLNLNGLARIVIPTIENDNIATIIRDDGSMIPEAQIILQGFLVIKNARGLISFYIRSVDELIEKLQIEPIQEPLRERQETKEKEISNLR